MSKPTDDPVDELIDRLTSENIRLKAAVKTLVTRIADLERQLAEAKTKTKG